MGTPAGKRTPGASSKGEIRRDVAPRRVLMAEVAPTMPESCPDAPEPAKPTPRATRALTIYTRPVPAPRMSQRDKIGRFRTRRCQRYFEFRDAVRRAMNNGFPTITSLAQVDPPDCVRCLFWIGMPKSWRLDKCIEMNGKPHRVAPDGDNLFKAQADSMFGQDRGIWLGQFEKRWCLPGDDRIEVRMEWY